MVTMKQRDKIFFANKKKLRDEKSGNVNKLAQEKTREILKAQAFKKRQDTKLTPQNRGSFKGEKMVMVKDLDYSKEEIIDIIKSVSRNRGYKDVNGLLRVAKAESDFNPKAKNPKSSARGLFQILDMHNLSPEERFDPIKATNWAIDRAEKRGYKDWNASKDKWEKDTTDYTNFKTVSTSPMGKATKKPLEEEKLLPELTPDQFSLREAMKTGKFEEEKERQKAIRGQEAVGKDMDFLANYSLDSAKNSVIRSRKTIQEQEDKRAVWEQEPLAEDTSYELPKISKGGEKLYKEAQSLGSKAENKYYKEFKKIIEPATKGVDNKYFQKLKQIQPEVQPRTTFQEPYQNAPDNMYGKTSQEPQVEYAKGRMTNAIQQQRTDPLAMGRYLSGQDVPFQQQQQVVAQRPASNFSWGKPQIQTPEVQQPVSFWDRLKGLPQEASNFVSDVKKYVTPKNLAQSLGETIVGEDVIKAKEELAVLTNKYKGVPNGKIPKEDKDKMTDLAIKTSTGLVEGMVGGETMKVTKNASKNILKRLVNIKSADEALNVAKTEGVKLTQTEAKVIAQTTDDKIIKTILNDKTPTVKTTPKIKEEVPRAKETPKDPLIEEAKKRADKVFRLSGNSLEDINIIGSTANGKLNPNDLDILITPTKKLPKMSSVPKTSGESFYNRQSLAKVFHDELKPIFPDKKIHITISEYDPARGKKMSLSEYEKANTPPKIEIPLKTKPEAIKEAPKPKTLAVRNQEKAVAEMGKIVPKTPVKKTRGFIETIKESEKTAPQIKEAVKGMYKVRNTKELQIKAANFIKDFPETAQEVARSNKIDDVNVAISSELIKHLQNKGEYNTAIDIVENLAPKLTKAGRTVQATTIYNRLTPEGVLRFTQRQLNNANDLNPKLKLKLGSDKAREIVEMSKRIQKLSGKEKLLETKKMMKAIHDLVPSSLVQKISTIQTMAQLLNPKTTIRNLVGNAIFGGLDNVSQAVATPIDKLTSIITGKRTTALPSIKTQIEGIVKGGKTGLEEAKLGINTLDTQFDLPRTKVFRDGALGALEKTLDYTLRVPDRAAYQAAFDDSIRGAMKLAKTDKATPEMLAQAHLDGLYRTFQDDSIASKVFVGLKEAFNKLGLVDASGNRWGLGDLMLKYPNTPANLLDRGIDYSPAGFLKTLFEVTKPLVGKEFNQKKFVNSIARASVGSAGLVGMGLYLGKLGIITEAPSKDKDVRGMQQITGQGAYQINASAFLRYAMSLNNESAKIQDGDTLVTYDWAQPVAIPLSMGAKMAYAKPGTNIDSITGMAMAGGEAMSAGAETLAEQPLTRGLKTLFGYGDYIEGAKQVAKGLPSSFVPTISNQVRQLTDNTARSTKSTDGFKESINQAIYKIPGLSKTLPEKKGIFGETQEVYKGGTNNPFNVFLNPSFTTKFKSTPESKLVLDIFEKTGETKQFPRVAPTKVTDDEGNNIKLNPKQYQDFQKYIGDKTKESFKQLSESKEFEKMNDASKVNKISSMLTSIGADAKKEVLGIGQGSGTSDEAFMEYVKVRELSDDEFHSKIEELKSEGGDSSLMATSMVNMRGNDKAIELGINTKKEWSSLKIDEKEKYLLDNYGSKPVAEKSKLFADMINGDVASDRLTEKLIRSNFVTGESLLSSDIPNSQKALALYSDDWNKLSNEQLYDKVKGIAENIKGLDLDAEEKLDMYKGIVTGIKAIKKDELAVKTGLISEGEKWSGRSLDERTKIMWDKVKSKSKEEQKNIFAEWYAQGLITSDLAKKLAIKLKQ